MAAPIINADISTISGAQTFAADTDITGTNGTAVYVQVYKVETATGKIKAYGETSATPVETAVTYTLNYEAEAGVTIEGGNGVTVTAVPDVDYHFVNWSDGKTSASRQDTNVNENIDVSTIFEADSSMQTTPAAVTYNWYRMLTGHSENGKLVGEGTTYKLISADIGKYIKLVVSYSDETFEKITSKILGNSSSISTSFRNKIHCK